MTASEAIDDMTCPRCARRLRAERLEGYSGETCLWKCPCGFRRVVAESGIVLRPDVTVTPK